jgi:hypothetical protein
LTALPTGSSSHEFLLDQIIEFVYLRFLIVSNEDIFFVFVFKLGSLRVRDFPVCYASKYLEMCNVGFVAAPEFLGVLSLRNVCGHRLCMYTAYCTASAQNSFGISLVLIIDLTMSRIVLFFSLSDVILLWCVRYCKKLVNHVIITV